MAEYVCMLCGLQLNTVEEVAEHFKLLHQEEYDRLNGLRGKPLRPRALCRALRRSGYIVNVDYPRWYNSIHICKVCGQAFSTTLAVVTHFTVTHSTLLPPFNGRRAPAKTVYVNLLKRNLIQSLPPDDLVRARHNTPVGRHLFQRVAGECWGELEALILKTLSEQKGRKVRLRPSQVAEKVVNGRIPEPYALLIAAALGRLLQQWLQEKKEVTDTIGRRWRLTGSETRRRRLHFIFTRL